MRYTYKVSIAFTIAAFAGFSLTCTQRQSPAPTPVQNTSSTPTRSVTVPPSLGWDLTYQSVLRSNGIGPDSVLWEWAQVSRPPVPKLLTEWQGEPIVSSMLIEVLGPDGDQHAYWFARTMNYAFNWQFTNGEIDDHHAREATPVQKYDEAFKAMSSWQQGQTSGEGLTGGYIGFLSLYDGGNSRQMLLTVEDLGTVDNKGRLVQVLGKLLENPNKASSPTRPT